MVVSFFFFFTLKVNNGHFFSGCPNCPTLHIYSSKKRINSVSSVCACECMSVQKSNKLSFQKSHPLLAFRSIIPRTIMGASQLLFRLFVVVLMWIGMANAALPASQNNVSCTSVRASYRARGLPDRDVPLSHSPLPGNHKRF